LGSTCNVPDCKSPKTQTLYIRIGQNPKTYVTDRCEQHLKELTQTIRSPRP
jgi:hypothetical protein